MLKRGSQIFLLCLVTTVSFVASLETSFSTELSVTSKINDVLNVLNGLREGSIAKKTSLERTRDRQEELLKTSIVKLGWVRDSQRKICQEKEGRKTRLDDIVTKAEELLATNEDRIKKISDRLDILKAGRCTSEFLFVENIRTLRQTIFALSQLKKIVSKDDASTKPGTSSNGTIPINTTASSSATPNTMNQGNGTNNVNASTPSNAGDQNGTSVSGKNDSLPLSETQPNASNATALFEYYLRFSPTSPDEIDSESLVQDDPVGNAGANSTTRKAITFDIPSSSAAEPLILQALDQLAKRVKDEIEEIQDVAIDLADGYVEYRIAADGEIKELHHEINITNQLLDEVWPRQEIGQLELEECHKLLGEFKINVDIAQEELTRVGKEYANRVWKVRQEVDTFEDIFRLYSNQVAAKQGFLEKKNTITQVDSLKNELKHLQ